MKKVSAEIPASLAFLFDPHRYKVARGGRGSAKSWSFARAILILGARRKRRVLCAREIQLSIRQSVHKLLKDQIELIGLGHFYEVFDAEIRGKNGTEINFTGLSSLTIDTIKSFEGVDICWVEEGQTISHRSWEILIPTIRKSRSEIWITYNPDLETDETHQRFTIDPPDDCVNVEMNWMDNPWFPDVLNKERLRCQEYNPDDYGNIWEGQCRPAVEGAIYYKQIQQAEQQGRICNVPYDSMLQVHVVYDLGWEDSLGVGLVQVKTSEVRIIEYIEASHTSHDIFSAELRTRPYNWGKVWLPHDGFAKSLKSGGKSDKDILESLGWKVAARTEISEASIEQGIRQVRMIFPRVFFDVGKVAASKAPKFQTIGFKETEYNNRLIECLKQYKRHVNVQTDTVSAPVKSAVAHGADVMRYLCLNAEKMDNVSQTIPIRLNISRYGHSQNAWMN